MATITTTVEVAFFDVPFEANPDWIDITDHVHLVQGQISIQRGRPDEFGAIQPGQMTLLVDNSDGFFKPDDPDVIFDPSISPYRRIRVRSTCNGVTVSRFDGHVTRWVYSWRGGQSVVAVSASDRLAVVNKFGPLRSFLAEEILRSGPTLTYLPLSDPDGATMASNLAGTQQAANLVNLGGSGTATFGGGTGPPADGASALQLAPAGVSNGWYAQAPAGNFTLLGYTIQAWVAGSTASQTVIALLTDGAVTARIGFDAAKKLVATADGGLLTATSPTVVADGATHHVAATVTMSGGTHTLRVYVDGAQVASASRSDPTTSARGTRITVGSDGVDTLLAGTVSNAALHQGPLSADRISTIYHAGWDGFGGERSDQRVSRIAGYVGLTSQTPTDVTGVWLLGDTATGVLGTTTVLAGSDLSLEIGSATVWGQSAGGTDPAQAFADVATTEGGVVLVDRDGLLAFQSRQHRYNAEDRIVVDASEMDGDLTLSMDDQQLTTDVTATTQDGCAQRAFTAGFAVSNFGTHRDELQLLTRDKNDAFAAATWRLSRYSVPAWRANGVSFDLLTLPDNRSAQLLAMDVSDAFRVASGLDPTQSPVTDLRLVLEGYTETISASQYRLECNTSNASLYRVWTLDDPVLSVLDDTTTLAY